MNDDTININRAILSTSAYITDVSVTGATFSEPDRKYRYTLTRLLTEATDTQPLCIIGLNPSTADERINDPTIRREIGFARRDGHTSLRKANLFGLRSTDPLALWASATQGFDPVGEANDAAILACALTATRVVVAWGTHANRNLREMIEARAKTVCVLLRKQNIDTFCFGTNKNGSPKHPLYLSADTQIALWNPVQ